MTENRFLNDWKQEFVEQVGPVSGPFDLKTGRLKYFLALFPLVGEETGFPSLLRKPPTITILSWGPSALTPCPGIVARAFPGLLTKRLKRLELLVISLCYARECSVL